VIFKADLYHSFKRDFLSHLPFYFLIYILLICSQGIYLYGNDLIEVLPYLKKLSYPELYSNDLYISSAWQKPIFERTAFIYLLKILHAENTVIRCLLHAILTIILLHGINKLGIFFIKKQTLVYWFIFAYFIISPRFSFGGNEIYYNSLLASLLAKTFAIYAFYFYLKDKYFDLFLCLSFATIFQAAVGFQLWFLFGIIGLIQYKKLGFVKYFKPFTIFGLPTILYLLLLLFYSSNAHHITNDIFQIQEFRNGHHLLFRYLLYKDIISYIILFAIGVWYYINICQKISTLYIVQFTFLILYIIATSYYKFNPFFNFYWFKTTIYIELFSFIAITDIISSRFPAIQKLIKKESILAISISAFCILFLGKNHFNLIRESNDERIVSQYIKENTSIDAVCLIPPDFTSFKFVSERSSYVDFKAFLQDSKYFYPWYDRVQDIYNITYEDRLKKDNLFKKSIENYDQINWVEKIKEIETKKIDYIIIRDGSPASNSLKQLKLPYQSISNYIIVGTPKT